LNCPREGGAKGKGHHFKVERGGKERTEASRKVPPRMGHATAKNERAHRATLAGRNLTFEHGGSGKRGEEGQRPLHAQTATRKEKEKNGRNGPAGPTNPDVVWNQLGGVKRSGPNLFRSRFQRVGPATLRAELAPGGRGERQKSIKNE